MSSDTCMNTTNTHTNRHNKKIFQKEETQLFLYINSFSYNKKRQRMYCYPKQYRKANEILFLPSSMQWTSLNTKESVAIFLSDYKVAM